MASEAEINGFLQRFKENWPPMCVVVLRDTNNDALLELRLLPSHRKEEIMSLTTKHYHKGPEPDRGRPGEEVWMFKKRIKDQDVYIKLKIYEVKGELYGKCISFHP